MSFLRYINRALASFFLVVILTGWFVMPLGTWVPQVIGCEHVVRVGLDHCNLHLAIIHADGSVDHKNHGPDCPGHPVPEGTSDHSKHGVHMPQLERENIVGSYVPAPAIMVALLPFAQPDLVCPDLSLPGNQIAPAGFSPPTELQKTTVLLI
jgi:hypothetical protein